MPRLEFGAEEFAHYARVAKIMAASCGYAKMIPMEDCVGYAMAAVAKAWPQYDPKKVGGNIKAYLVQRMHWALADALRSEKIVRRKGGHIPTRTVFEQYTEKDFLDTFQRETPPAQAEHDAAESRRRVLEHFPHELRGVVKLCLLDRMTQRGAARALGITPAQVQRRIKLAKKIIADDSQDSGT